MPKIINDITNEITNGIVDGVTGDVEQFPLLDQTLIYIIKFGDIIFRNKFYITMILIGLFLVLMGLYISIYKKAFTENRKKLSHINNVKYLKYLEVITNRFPFRFLSQKLNQSIAYFMLNDTVQRSITAIFTLALPTAGILLYISLKLVLNLWYTRLITLVLCIMVPYYIFTLAVDYMKYRLRLKIPLLIDSFRSSFLTHYRIKPALQECCLYTDKSLGRIMSRVSDSSDLNESLCTIRDRINDTWFNIFVLLLVNYRENGGELIMQLYKLNISITRYNNIEKKKNKRLIWYEVFTIATSIFSLPVILFINKIILGNNVGLYYDATTSFAKIVAYSLAALIIVRILRRM